MTNVARAATALKTTSSRSVSLSAKDLGRIVVVQGPGSLTSLVRVADGRATCDCSTFRVSRQPCCHVAAAARLLGGAV
jgi:hypothetical protein